MQKNKLVILNLAAIACVFGTAGGSLAQTVALTSSQWSGLTGPPLFVGPPIFAVSLTSAASGTFGAGSLTAGSSTTVTFSPSNLSPFVFNSGLAGTTTNGSGTGSFIFNVAGGVGNVSVPLNYTVTDQSNGIGNALFGITSTTQTFIVTNGLSYEFNFQINPTSSLVTENAPNQTVSPITGTLTFVGVAPEPGSLALLSLGVMPIVVAVRRRRK